MDFDTIIVGGGSAGSVLANRLSARGGHRVPLLEAGQDITEDSIPPEIADSYPGVAYFDPRFHWTGLQVRNQPVSHNNPTDLPPLRKYEQARVYWAADRPSTARWPIAARQPTMMKSS